MKIAFKQWLQNTMHVIRKMRASVLSLSSSDQNDKDQTPSSKITEKQRQIYRLIGLSVIVMCLLSVVIYFLNGDTATKTTTEDHVSTQRSETLTPLASALDTVTLDDRWLSKEDDQLQSHDQLLKQLKHKVNQLTQSRKKDQAHTQTLQAQLNAIKVQHEKQLHDLANRLKQHSTTSIETAASSNPMLNAMIHAQTTDITSSNAIDQQTALSDANPNQTSYPTSTLNPLIKSPFHHAQFLNPKRKRTNSKQTEKTTDYLPAGTFAKAILLGGLDAATDLSASNNPRPVLLKIIDQGELPNHQHAHLKGCVITAAGMGDVSSERGYIRLERLSCVNTQHGKQTIIDVPVFGTVFGPSGQDGVRGTAVYRAKQLVTNSFAAGLASGFGKALQDQSMTAVSATPYGMAAQFTPAKTLEAGAANGVNTALDRLADYYIKRAERYHPIVQIHAGTLVDVVFLKGVLLRPYQGEADSPGLPPYTATNSAQATDNRLTY